MSLHTLNEQQGGWLRICTEEEPTVLLLLLFLQNRREFPVAALLYQVFSAALWSLCCCRVPELSPATIHFKDCLLRVLVFNVTHFLLVLIVPRKFVRFVYALTAPNCSLIVVIRSIGNPPCSADVGEVGDLHVQWNYKNAGILLLN